MIQDDDELCFLTTKPNSFLWKTEEKNRLLELLYRHFLLRFNV